ncbi:hypothetical protein [Hoylesella enoeca]|uniref:hypothetical protein n=1 Tax=Hoylesella enoeca TaxID=76123 RepID=UPI00288AC42C|nr:hypothetical protein [Hoylesella enoeca]
MQQTISFETSAQVRQPLDVRATIQRKIKSLNLWLDSKSNFYTLTCGFGKKTPKSLPIQKTFVSLPCLNHKSGTDAAESSRLFLYPHFSENNTAAPCRVMETSRKPRFYELRQHVAQFLFCLNHKVMATTINAVRPARRAFTLKEWLNAKSQFYTQICEFPVTRLLAIRLNLVALCLIVAAVAVEQQPVASVVSTLCTAWLVYRVNKTDKEQKGGKNDFHQ